MRRRPFLIVILWIVAALTGSVTSGSVAKPTTSEYANLPVSTAELRANIRHANLIVRAKIVAYKPPTFGGHSATMEETTVVVETTYTGTIKPGETLTYQCICHQIEQPPSSADLIGHEVVLFLSSDKRTSSWSPATREYKFFFHPELETRLKKMLARKP